MKAWLGSDGGKIVCDPAWNEVDLLKQVAGYRYLGASKEHTVPLTWAALVQLRGLFGPRFVYDDDLTAWAWQERQTRIDPSLGWREVTAASAEDAGELYPFQVAGVSWMSTAISGLLGDELGCGKTPQALAWLRVNQLLPAVVICPNSVKWHWAQRVPRWCPGATAYVVDGGTAKGRKTLAAAAEDEHAIVIINYEAVRAFSRLAPYGSVKLKRCQECDHKFGDDIRPTQCHVHRKELNGFGFRAAIIDEVHRCGDPKAQQTRATWAVVHDPSVEARWGLTGTPDHAKRLWGIMHTVAPQEYPSRTAFMDRYALSAYNAYGGASVIGLRPDTREELYRFLDPRFRRMLKNVVLPQLPPIVREVRYAVLTASQRKAYDELEAKLFTTLPNGQLLITANGLVARTRLMQFAAGSVTVDKPDPDDITTWKVRIGLPSPKLDVLDEVLDELGDVPFVIACEHVDLAKLAAERLAERDIRHQLIAGSVHPSTVQQATDELNTGLLRAIVFTHKKGGVGLDMSGAGTMIMLQRSWSLIEEVQTEGRAHRIGSEQHDVVRIIDIVTRDTREQRQIEKLYEKFEQLEEITRDRQQLQRLLVQTSPDDEVFATIVGRLNQLNERQERLFEIDDLEQLLAEETDE